MAIPRHLYHDFVALNSISTSRTRRSQFHLSLDFVALNSISKATALSNLIIEHKLDIIAVTESWLHGDNRDDYILADLKKTLFPSIMPTTNLASQELEVA